MTWFQNLREFLGWGRLSAFCITKDAYLCMVVSEQEGAEIWVEDRRTGDVTPKLMALPKNKDVKVTLRKPGFVDQTAWIRSSHNLSYYYCSLERPRLRLVSNEIHGYTSP
ncbi:MAG: hypothetical protein AAGB31_16100 [Bdellovibrio sp.]